MSKIKNSTRFFFALACIKTAGLLIYGSLNPGVADSVDKLMMWNIMFDLIVGGKVTAEKFLKLKFGAGDVLDFTKGTENINSNKDGQNGKS
jgi:hypothetical protein